MPLKPALPLSDKSNWWTDSLYLTLIFAALFFILLGARPLFVPDEGRYAEIAREMFTSGDYVTPYLNGIRYFEKPALFYWLGAGAIHIGGLNLWSLRSINALFGLIGCLATYLAGRQLFDRATGLLAALVLGTSTLYFMMAHTISLDMPVTVLITLTFYAFLLATHQPPSFNRRLLCWSAAATAALAVLCKGLIGLLFPVMVIGAWIALTSQWRMIKRLYIPTSLLLFFLIAAPWHFMVNARNPGFFHFYFIEQHFLRYATLDIGHYQPVWYFIPCLILGFFPWIAFLPQALFSAATACYHRFEHARNELFLLLWAVLVFAFFSFSKSKLIPYILPVFPAIALLTGHYLVKVTHQPKQLSLKVGYLFLFLLSGVIAYVFHHFTLNTLLPDPELAKVYLDSASAVLLLGMMVAGIYAIQNDSKSITITIVATCLFLLLTIGAMPAVDSRSILPFAEQIKPLLKPDDEVVTYNQYYQDLPFYLERRVSILNWRNELTYGMQGQDTREWMIDDATFWDRWHSKRRVYVVIGLDEYQQLLANHPNETVYLLGKTPNNALISNHPGQNPIDLLSH